MSNLSDHVNWQYVLREYWTLYRFGPAGPAISERLILGVVLLGPRCTYPEHSHDGITESYICLSGTVSGNQSSVCAPGSLLLNQPDQAHRLTTGDFEPTLLAYAWLGTPDKLTHQKMNFSRRS